MENRSWACGFVPACFRACLECQRRSCATNACPFRDLRPVPPHRTLVDLAVALASDEPTTETAPWSLSLLSHVTGALAGGAAVSDVAGQVGWSVRTLQRQCTVVYGYGPATLRRILRFRRAVRLLGDGLPNTEVAARAGYADQPHLHREARELAGVPLASLRQDSSSANRSTQLPSGSATVA